MNRLLRAWRAVLRQVCPHPMWVIYGKPETASTDVVCLVRCTACRSNGYVLNGSPGRPRWSRTSFQR